jgi:hypothetical protein
VKSFNRNSSEHRISGNEGEKLGNTSPKEMTNQKMRFDIDYSGGWLGVGDHNGDISYFALKSDESDVEALYSENTAEAGPSLKYHAHDDTIGSVAFHPTHPILLSVSGSRHFPELPSSSDSSEDDGNSVNFPETRTRANMVIGKKKYRPVALDASITMWRFDDSVEELVDVG